MGGSLVSFSDLFLHYQGWFGSVLEPAPCGLSHRADLDPVYFCELVRLCPIKDDGDAKITSLTVNPTSVPRGIGHQGYV